MRDREPSLLNKGRGCRGDACEDVVRFSCWRRSGLLMHIGDWTGWFDLVMAIGRGIGSLMGPRGGSLVRLRGVMLIVGVVSVCW